MPELLAFVDLCDAESQQQQLQSKSEPHGAVNASICRRESSRPSRVGERAAKFRPRRDTVDIAALRTQVEALTLQLAEAKAYHQSCGMTLAVGPSQWQTEA